MPFRFLARWIAICFAWIAPCSHAVQPTSAEMTTARDWVNRHLTAAALQFPFSFDYGSSSSSSLFKSWDVTESSASLDPSRTERTLTFLDPASGLTVRMVSVAYSDFPTLEWTLYFKNTGAADTPLLSNILPLDLRLDNPPDEELVLHHNTGSPMTAADYQPFETRLEPGMKQPFAGAGGRPTNAVLPYFNLAWPGAGMIAVIGWPGQWAAQFERDAQGAASIRGGQETTRFVLHPGEEVRSPLVVLQFWEGDWIRSQNIWRRWMIAHNLPRPEGKLPPPLFTPCSSHQYWEMTWATEESQIRFIDRYVEAGFKPDYWWMDAGWYVNTGSWGNTGTWEVDKQRFPHGLRAISDHAHALGIKTLLWFEPERVTEGTMLAEEHPDWVLGGKQGGLLNLGNAEAREWLTNHVDRLMTEQGIDLYRQDSNIDPLTFWTGNDATDRQGMTEIRHATGYLAYWDELLRRRPGMLIDSCASGGRRNDLETLRRAVPLLRSDYILEPVGLQNQMYGISTWMPYSGTGMRSAVDDESESYIFRSLMGIHFIPCWDLRQPGDPEATNIPIKPPKDVNELRRLTDQWRRIAPNYYGDYYPLTEYSTENNVWMAWQFDQPEEGEGIVQAFRRPENNDATIRLKLRGLEPEASYTVANLDEPTTATISGQALMQDGLEISLAEKPSAALILYTREK